MTRYLIEFPHEAGRVACARAVEEFLKTGSHLLTHADWGCKDCVHNTWLIADVENKDEARSIHPPALRSQAKITQLNNFSFQETNEVLYLHQH